MPKFTSTQLNLLRLQAKVRSRKLNEPLHHAQDKVANANGYSNWSLLMKNAAPDVSGVAQQFRFIRSDQDMREAMRNLPETFERASGRNARPNVDVPDIWKEFNSAKHAVDFAIDYMTTILRTPRFQVGMRSPVYWEIRNWLPYVLEPAKVGIQLVANRYYKPVGMDVTELVDYKKFDQLHTKLSSDEIASFSHSPTGQGYLYGDSPWSSRKAAQTYVKRLQILKSLLK